MARVFLVSETTLKKQTAINDNVDSGQLRNAISVAQDINLQESLSTSLYNKILELVDTGAITGSTNANYKTLLDDFIVPMVIQYSYFYAMDDFIMKFMNVGLVQGFSEQGNALDINIFKMLKNAAKDKAEWYDNRLRDHLFNNEHLYPSYVTSTTDGSLPAANTDGFMSSIVMDEPYYWRDYDPACCKGRYKGFKQIGK